MQKNKFLVFYAIDIFNPLNYLDIRKSPSSLIILQTRKANFERFCGLSLRHVFDLLLQL